MGDETIYEYVSPDQQPGTRVLVTQSARNRMDGWSVRRFDTASFVARARLAAEVTLSAVKKPLTKPEYVVHRERDRQLLIAVGVVDGKIQAVLMTECDLSTIRFHFGGKHPKRREWNEEIAA